MRIGITVDYGSLAKATSLNLIAKKVFLEMGKIMNIEKTFTIAALKYEDIGIGDFNEHFDCVSIPNMGGYKFPREGSLSCNNLMIGLIGIDEVILGEQVYRTKEDWKINKPIIEREVPKWERFGDHVMTIHVASNSEKEQMIQYLRIPEEKIHVIPLGVDHDQFKPPPDKFKARKKILGKFFIRDSPYFIHLSETNFARKNILRMLEAFKKARGEGIKQKLIIVGKMEPQVYNAAESIDGVIILGFVSEEHLVELLQGADALIFPSLHEGFGLPAVEAMSCGIPVITSNVFGLPEIVGDGGMYVNPYDTSDIADKIIEVSRNEKLRLILADGALKTSRKYSWQTTASELLKLIRTTVKYENNFDYDESLDLSAYRTLTTICNITPGLREISGQDLIQFDYSRIIPWAREVGLENPDVKDFLLPFKEWLMTHSN
ncbi:putative Phosphatidylinositol N-acetylglucosaminyltransferase [Nitrosotalea sinensis]|uniref:Putative Phosphatidylinositol N-acetylglucosaminyltransferase n=1 Tax=Nitrosotalea sinensis TaxID=1499975 RepID=A0A2H1EED0_9ARCH|nr:glycosyltransferase family 1 protein [Candidatus Nitrosotalea sinensis]SHO42833.1 putative Phosphatidylinositol N-acetylglucosaminyltransferase [Candidatus Nitrosotalea sinensis]